MSDGKKLKPTDGELEILRVLWSQGPSTVRRVMEVLNEKRHMGYTTALKLMQIMADKGLVTRDESKRTHVYHAACSEDDTQRHLVGDLMERAFENSAQKLVMHALSTQKASADDLAEIRKMLDEMEGKL